MSKELEYLKFRNAVIGINKKIQMAKFAAQIGMSGGDSIISKQIVKLDELCEKAIKKEIKK